MKIDKKIIKELTDYLNEFSLTEIEYTEKDTKIKVSKSNITSANQNLSISKSTSPQKIADKEMMEIFSGIIFVLPLNLIFIFFIFFIVYKV